MGLWRRGCWETVSRVGVWEHPHSTRGQALCYSQRKEPAAIRQMWSYLSRCPVLSWPALGFLQKWASLGLNSQSLLLAFHFSARIEPGIWAWQANSQLLGSTAGLTVQTSL